MRHVQQLQLVEKFKYECKTKGYAQPTIQALALNEMDETTSLTRERRANIRWVRSRDTATNDSIDGISLTAHQFHEPEDNSDFIFDGVFHEPANSQAPNDYLEAICGNLTLT